MFDRVLLNTVTYSIVALFHFDKFANLCVNLFSSFKNGRILRKCNESWPQ